MCDSQKPAELFILVFFFHACVVSVGMEELIATLLRTRISHQLLNELLRNFKQVH